MKQQSNAYGVKGLNQSHLNFAQKRIVQLYRDLLHVTNFTSLSNLHSIRQYNGGAAACVVAVRFGKGLFTEDRDKTRLLAEKCLSDTLRADADLSVFNRSTWKPSPCYVERLEKAAALVEDWFSDIDFRKLEAKLPPGETVIPGLGKVSIYQKLKGPWTVTEDAAVPFATLIARTRYLRKCFYSKLYEYCKKYFRNRADDSYRELVRSAYTYAKRKCRAAIREGSYINHIGRVSEASFSSNVRQLVVLILSDYVFIKVRGSRITSVPKDTEKRRPINVEPLGNMLLQLAIGSLLKGMLRDKAKNCLYTGQATHRQMCKNLQYATVDFSGASDSVSLGGFRQLFKRLPKLVRFIERIRSPEVGYLVENDASRDLSPLERILSPYMKWVQLNKLSSMGNGFTFEVLTTILLSIARTFDPTSRVYGDDVIIRREYFAEYCAVCESLGFKVNRDKSFSKRGFRESCGTFYMDGFGEILSFEFDAVCNTERLFTALNKLYLLEKFYRCSPWKRLRQMASMFSKARSDILRSIPGRQFLGPYCPPARAVNAHGYEETKVMGNYIMDDRWLEMGTSASLPCSIREEVERHLKQLGYGTGFATRRRIVGVDRFASKAKRETGSVFRIGHYLYSCMVSKDTVRQQPNERAYSSEFWIHYREYISFRLQDIFPKYPTVPPVAGAE